MPALVEEAGPNAAPAILPSSEYAILKQRVDLDVDFARRSLRGSTEITVQPLIKDIKYIRLHCSQCRPLRIQAGGITARWDCEDPYRRLRMPESSTVYQHEMLKRKIETALGPAAQPSLEISLPAKLKIQELQVDPISALPQYPITPSLQKQESDAMAVLETPTGPMPQQGPQFAPIMLYIEFEVENFRDGLHWIGFDATDNRYPHVYSKAEQSPGNTSCIFPCLDDAASRCSWDISIRCPKTLGDAFRKSKAEIEADAQNLESQVKPPSDADKANGSKEAAKVAPVLPPKKPAEYSIDLTEPDAALDLTILCIGEMVEDITDAEDESRHTVSFSLGAPVTARHVGFAIGPFESVDLAAFREVDDEEKLGQSAVKISGYCLPTRVDELRNTAVPVHLAIDFFGVNYGSFPFSNYQMLFVDDLVHDTVPVAGMSICSSRLLFSEDVLEPIDRNTKILMRAVADQWMGVNVIAKEPSDAWVVAGIAGYMTDLFNKRLFGNNDYRWAQKAAAERIYDLDVDRPSMYQLGTLLDLDPSIREFVDLKSALVLFILDRRLMKASSSTGVTRIINKIFLNTKTGSLINGELSTSDFQRTCEKLGHNKLDPFFKQWVFGSGCPIFEVKQRFNKKKLVVEMTITQRQMERTTKPPFAPSNFMREIKEHVQEVWAPEVQPVFTGPMTIRIHEADGTPYEHIVEIKEQVTKLEIPYNTKYKRLKRSRRQRERAMAATGNNETNGEGGDDALLYCLGDIFDSPQEVQEWRLKDWTPEEEEKMGQESYEWIRMDADFEWIGRIHLWLPLYMYVSQLQQDRDLAAQYDSVKYIQICGAHHVSLSVLVRTLMDRRYFHGIRTMAADAIAALSQDHLQEVGQFHLEKAFSEHFCFEGSIMPRPNDWSSRVNFILQCAIPNAMAKLRDAEGKVPFAIRRFFVDKLKFNDNSNNDFSDAHYLATLMTCLADSLVASHRAPQPSYTFNFGGDEPMEPDNPDADFENEAVGEIERYRRIDEWISTYQNVYSVTALDCLQKLTKVGIVKDKTRELLIYTRKVNADNVRLEAYRCLNEMGVSKKTSMLRYLLHELADDTSPFFRDNLTRAFGEALGHIALGDEVEETPQIQSATETGLILEQEVSTEARHVEISRKTTPEGALAALKLSLSKELLFQDALWYAITSPNLTLEEAAAFTDIAAMLYDAKTSYVTTLQLPRPYKAEKLREGTVRFYQQGAYRTKPRKPLAAEDWQSLQARHLSYSGPLATDVQKLQTQFDEEKSLLSQIEAIKEQQASISNLRIPESAVLNKMPPPPSIPTPSTEKSGFKLSLGAKRKQSVASLPEGTTPKAPKVSKNQTAHGSAISRASPGTGGERRPSTPGSAASFGSNKKGPKRSKVVVLPLGGSASQAKEILSGPRRPSSLSQPRPPSRSHSLTPGLPKTQNGFLPSAKSPTSPELYGSPSQTASPSQQQQPRFNMGGFRSFGPPVEADANAKSVAVEKATSGSPDVKRESVDRPSTDFGLEDDDLPTSSPIAPSPQEAVSNGAGETAGGLAPPKKKLTLKLGKRD